jgi:hypothetical protein
MNLKISHRKRHVTFRAMKNDVTLVRINADGSLRNDILKILKAKKLANLEFYTQ